MRIIMKILKIAGLVLAAVIVLGTAFFIHVWYFKPFNINLFFDRVALQFALDSPETLTYLHVLEQFGIKGHCAKLDDASIAHEDRMFSRIREAHRVLLSYEDADLSDADKLSKEIILALLDDAIEGEKFRFHNFPVSQMMGLQSAFPSFMESEHQVESARDAQDYVKRLAAVGTKFDQVLEQLRRREELGILPPQLTVDKVLAEMTSFVKTPSDQGILYKSLIEKMDKADIDAETKARLALEAKGAIENTVYPAYGRLISFFEALDAKVDGNFGAWHLPDGDALYRYLLKSNTTTDYTPKHIHELGLKEVARIEDEMLAILQGKGWDVSGGFTAVMKAFSEDKRFYYPDDDKGREQIMKDYQAMIDEMTAGLPRFFKTLPKAKVGVKRVPQFMEKTTPNGYYEPPAMDGSRPGAFYANLYDIKATPKYGMRALTYHEAVPGHHLQLSIQQEQEDLPFIRRLIPFSAYAEGWAMYSEQLAWEQGFVKDPYDKVGRLQSELFRAVRLVVDTGIHTKRWSREQAIDYMIANTGMTQSDVVIEIERYFVMPAQACSYKVGMIKLLELRERAKKELGSKFDLGEFHEAVLRPGSVPLSVLEKLVIEYINKKKSGV